MCWGVPSALELAKTPRFQIDHSQRNIISLLAIQSSPTANVKLNQRNTVFSLVLNINTTITRSRESRDGKGRAWFVPRFHIPSTQFSLGVSQWKGTKKYMSLWLGCNCCSKSFLLYCPRSNLSLTKVCKSVLQLYSGIYFHPFPCLTVKPNWRSQDVSFNFWLTSPSLS